MAERKPERAEARVRVAAGWWKAVGEAKAAR